MDDFSQLTTPAFLVDRAIMQRNCDRMHAKAAASKVIFRPHVKTHKVAEIGRMQHGGEAGPITASTLAEVEHFAAAGFRDITYAVPIAPEKLSRAAEIARRIDRLNILVDSFETVDAIEAFGSTFDAFLKIDCGYHRAGVDPNDPASLVLARRMMSSKALRLHGLLTHAGHSYNAKSIEDIRAVAKQETAAVTKFRERLGTNLIRSVGSTPTASVVDRFTDCDEVRPGNYVFYDAFQATIGSCRFEDVAVSVLTTVIGSYPERNALIVDAGALALSKDLGPDHIDPRFGYGVICNLDLHPLPMKLVAISQEHGKVATMQPLPVGMQLRVVPNHSCLTAAMYDQYHVVENRRIVDQWHPMRGW
ncbi:MAG TPA: alanine racemase [Thermoanaerobaculia bacterium]|jgi:D-serine deaminase-like pyridoxal phosphate-dependent protein|nr:alanine racemase [Thermoanaerobaculia bacterium]